MSADDTETVDVEALVEELRRKVAHREAEGAYPPGIDDRLDGHFARIAVHRTPPVDFGPVRHRLAELDAAARFSAEQITTATRLPGGSQLHRTVGKLVSRQTEGILAQVHGYADAVREALWALLAVIESPGTHAHADLLARLDTVLDRLAELERARPEAAELADLERRIAALEAERRG